ncbi:MAG: DUF5455 family protein [Panacagrimonas sp.]
MPLLAAFIGSLFSTFVTWLGTYLTKRAANYIAMTVTLAASVGIAWLAVSASLAALILAVPAELVTASGWFLPTNLDDCLAARVGCEVAIAGYRWHRDTVRASAAVL